MSSPSSSSSSSSDTTSVTSDDDQREHILKIDLDSLESARTILTARRATTLSFHPGNSPAQEDFDIAACILHHAGKGQEGSFRVITRSSDSETPSPREHWLHLATECISFEDFKRLAINITLEHHANWTPVVMYLLNHIKDNYECSSAYGSYIQPGTVIRCDGMERKHRSRPDVSVTFISFPFFDVGQGDYMEAPSENSLHLTRSLFQQFYPQEITKDRDDDQQFRRFRQTQKGQYLRVPQLWTLILNSTTIITCGPTSLVEMAQGWLEIVPEDSLVSTRQCLIHVTDFHKCVTFLAPERCGSFLALKQTIQKECLSETKEHIDQCLLHLGDSEAILDPSLWPKLLRDTQTALLYIRISLKDRTDVTQDDETLRIEAPDMPRMIQYTDLESEDESAKGKQLALFVSQPQLEQTSQLPKSSKAAASTRIRLEDQGYVVNKEKSLEDEESVVFHSGKPKIFRRPTIADAGAEQADPRYDSSTDSNHSHEQAEGDDYDADSEEGDGRASTFTEKQVRFQHVDSEEEWESKVPSLSQNARSYPENDTVDGAVPLISDGSSDASVTLPGSPLVESHDGSPGPLSAPTRAIYQAKPKSLNATVDDYSSESSSYDESVDLEPRRSSADDSYMPPTSIRKTSPSSGSDRLRASRRFAEDDTSSVPATGQHDGDSTGQNSTKRSGTTLGKESMPEILTGQDMKQVIREEIAAALKYNNDEFEKRHEQAMRMKLAQFGFQENQIQALLHPEQQPILSANPTSTTPQPTYIKIHRNHIDLETLHYYDIPYEYDMDPEYIIVLREMSNRETEVLFEHTRRLRSHHKERQSIENKPRSPSNSRSRSYRSPSRDSYHFVRQRSKGNPSNSVKAGGSSYHVNDITKPGKSRPSPIDGLNAIKRKSSTEYTSNCFSSDLRVPAFLAWPTTFEKKDARETSGRVGKEPLDVDADENLRIKLTLLAIKDRIYQAHKDHGQKVSRSDLVIYKSGATVVEISKRSCPKRLLHEVDMGPMPKQGSEAEQDSNKLCKELAFLQSQNHDSDTDAKPEIAPTLAGPVSVLNPPNFTITEPVGRRIIPWQMAKLHINRYALVSSFQQLVCQFVPEIFDHTLVQRCWGSMETINKAVIEACNENERYQRDEADQHFPPIWIIKDIPDNDYLKFHQTKGLSSPIHPCSLCQRGKRYPDIDDALNHLQETHAKSWTETEVNARSCLKHWLVSTSTQEREIRNEQLLEFVETILRCTRKLLAKAIDIRSSVANEDNTKSNNYLLPTALVKAAEKMFQYVYYTAHSLQMWQEKGSVPTAPKNVQPLLAAYPNVTGAEYFAKITDSALSNARDELMLMAHTGESRDHVLHYRTTPESTVLITLFVLAYRPLLHGLEIRKLYRQQLVRLRYEASRDPSKRILRELYLWKEEIEVVDSVVKQQADAFHALKGVLDSSTFRITNRVRIKAFKEMETPSIRNILEGYESTHKEDMRSLYKEADKLTEYLRHNIAIAEEGNSKAILIFTLVTIVFLPLSFVSSVFGMNTVDIRDTESTQTLFWAIALPVTAIVGGISLLAAYGGPSLKRHIPNLKSWRTEMQFLAFKRRHSDEEDQAQLIHNEKVSTAQSRLWRSKGGVFRVTKREVLLGKRSKKVPTHPSAN